MGRKSTSWYAKGVPSAACCDDVNAPMVAGVAVERNEAAA